MNLKYNQQGLAFLFACLAGILYWLVLWFTAAKLPPAYPGVMMFLWLTIVSPILEELAFRGFLQGELSRFLHWKKYQISASNIVTSLVFCLLHFALYRTIWSSLVFFPSLIFGYFKDRTQSVKPSTALHIFYNLGYFGLFGI